jgi:hypothetical protein
MEFVATVLGMQTMHKKKSPQNPHLYGELHGEGKYFMQVLIQNLLKSRNRLCLFETEICFCRLADYGPGLQEGSTDSVATLFAS